MKKTTITLEKDDVALVFTGKDVKLYLHRAGDDKPASVQVLSAMAIAMLFSNDDIEFGDIIIKAIDKIIALVGEDDGS